MECPRFVEEKIGEGEGPDFRRHLASCPACAQDVEELRELRDLYRAASVERYAGGVPRKPRGRSAVLAPAALAAAMVVALAVGVIRPAPEARKEEPRGAGFIRIHLEPWAGEESLANQAGELWNRLSEYERSLR
jgi:anti-sigma factor RsiW